MNDIEIVLIEYVLDINKIFIIGNDEEKVWLFLLLKYDDIILNEYVLLFI